MDKVNLLTFPAPVFSVTIRQGNARLSIFRADSAVSLAGNHREIAGLLDICVLLHYLLIGNKLNLPMLPERRTGMWS